MRLMESLRERLLKGGVILLLNDVVVDDEIKAKLKKAEGSTKDMWKEVECWVGDTVLVPWPALTTEEKSMVAWWVHNRVILQHYKRGSKNGRSLGKYTSLKTITVANALSRMTWNEAKTEKALCKWGQYGDGERLVVVEDLVETERKKVADITREMVNAKEDLYNKEDDREDDSYSEGKISSEESSEVSSSENGDVDGIESGNESDSNDKVDIEQPVVEPSKITMVVPMKGVGSAVPKPPQIDHTAAMYKALPRVRPRAKSMGPARLTYVERVRRMEEEVRDVRIMAEATGEIVGSAQRAVIQKQVEIEKEHKQQKQLSQKRKPQQQLLNQQQMASKGLKAVEFVPGEVMEPTSRTVDTTSCKRMEDMERKLEEIERRVAQVELREEAVNRRIKALEDREKSNNVREEALNRKEAELNKREGEASRRNKKKPAPSPRTVAEVLSNEAKTNEVEVSWANRAEGSTNSSEIPRNLKKPSAKPVRSVVSPAARGESKVEVFIPAGATRNNWEEELRKEGFKDISVRRGATGWVSIHFKTPDECNRALEERHRWGCGLEVRRGITVAERNRRRMEQEARRVDEGRRRMLGSWGWGGPRGESRRGPWYYSPGY